MLVVDEGFTELVFVGLQVIGGVEQIVDAPGDERAGREREPVTASGALDVTVGRGGVGL